MPQSFLASYRPSARVKSGATDPEGQTAVKLNSLDTNILGVAELREVPGQVPAGTVEIQGVSAGPFNPEEWQLGTLNWVPDVRMPMLAPLTTGPFQNIYAPWPLEQSTGWRLFYGGWDGTDTGNDRVYSVTTADFLSFGNRSLVIDHGDFVHVNNVNVQQLPDGSLHMICTVLPSLTTRGDGRGYNKPVYFFSPDGVIWNGSPEPYAAKTTDIVRIYGYAPFETGDFNGANVLLRDNGSWVLYFKDWNEFATTYPIYRATADALPEFQLAGVSLTEDLIVNDVKKFAVGMQDWYLMGLHANGQRVWYSLSNDGVTFGVPAQMLFSNLSDQDRYIVALGFVPRGNQLLGVLYGATAEESLDHARLFARWLQKKVLITDSAHTQYPLEGGYGPDRQWFQAPESGSINGTLTVFAEDGVTLLAEGTVEASAGKAYQLVVNPRSVRLREFRPHGTRVVPPR